MKATWARLKNITFRGKTRIPWAEREINEYVAYLEQEHPAIASQLEKTPFVKFHGAPHETDKTKDPWHASAAFRRKEDFKGSGVSLHVYPDGKVVPSKAEFPMYQATPATAEDLGKENMKWLDPDFVAAWQAAGKTATASRDKKNKGKAKAGSSKSSSSNRHKSSGKHDSFAGSSSTKGKGIDHSPYSMDPNSGLWYRYADNGAIVYLDPESQREYYVGEHGQAVWV